jgi:hypothetical protein
MRLHIKRINLLWYCAGAGRIAFGYDPTQALSEWQESFYLTARFGCASTTRAARFCRD